MFDLRSKIELTLFLQSLFVCCVSCAHTMYQTVTLLLYYDLVLNWGILWLSRQRNSSRGTIYNIQPRTNLEKFFRQIDRTSSSNAKPLGHRPHDLNMQGGSDRWPKSKTMDSDHNSYFKITGKFSRMRKLIIFLFGFFFRYATYCVLHNARERTVIHHVLRFTLPRL